jgi:hypothetical protein
MFLEESGTKDYVGLTSFVGLSYIMVPFQAYAAVKGFLEKAEGPWFRTPKTGRITDVFKRSEFYKFISGILPGGVGGLNQSLPSDPNSYLSLATANNRFDRFDIRRQKNRRWLGKAFLAILLIISTTVTSMASGISTFSPTEVKAETFSKPLIKPENNFPDGVIAVNLGKSVYSKGEIAKLAIAVLDGEGKMICDADVKLEITAPSGKIVTLSTADKTITVNNECYIFDLNTKQDFETEYITEETGVHNLNLEVNARGKEKTLQSAFSVDDSRPFDVERDTLTRIYPQKSTPVEIKVKANQDFSGTITDTIPGNFALVNNANSKTLGFSEVKTQGDKRLISWSANIKKGETKSFKYTYDAPDKSPDYYELGPLKFFDRQNNVVYQELRVWQLAIDSTRTWDGGGVDSNWSTKENWSNDTTPIVGDFVIFNNTGTLKDSIVDAGFTATISSLSINSGYTRILSLGGNLTTNAFSQADGTFNLAGYNLTISSSGSFSQTGGTFDGGSGTIGIGNSFSVTNSGTSFTATSGTMTVGGDFTLGAGITFTHNSGTITLNNNPTTVTCNGASFNKINLTKSNSYQKIIINANCNLPLGSTPTITGYLDSSGTLSGTGTLTIDSAADSSHINVIRSGPALSGFTGISVGSGRYFTISGADLDLSSFTTAAFGSFTLSSGTFTPPSTGTTMTTYTSLTISGGTFLAGTGNITVQNLGGYNQSGGTFNAPSGTLTVTNTFTQTGGTFNGGSGTIDINGSLSVTNAGTSFTATSGTMTVSDNFTLGSGITFTHNSGTITFDTGNSLTIACNGAGFYHIDINKTAYVKVVVGANCNLPLGSAPTIMGYLDLSGTLSGSGKLTISSASDSSTYANLFKSGAALSGFTGISNTGYVTISGADINWSSLTTATFGAFTLSSGTFTPPSTGITMTASSSFTISGGTFNAGTGNITLNYTFSQSNGTFNAPSGTLTVTNTFTQTGGTFNGGSGTIDLNSSFTLNGAGVAFTATSGIMTVASNFALTSFGSFTHNSGTITFDGSNTAPITCNSAVLYNFRVNRPSSFFTTLGSDCTIANDFVKENTGDFDVTTANYNLTIGGNFTKTGGTFTQRSGTVTFNDATKISTLAYNTAITFYNLTISTPGKTVKFDNVDQTNVSHNFTVNGGSCNTLVQLLSDLATIRYEINVTGTASVQYAAIKDSAAIAAATASYSSSVSNNTGWTITGDSCLFSTNANATGYSFQRKTWFDGVQMWKSLSANSRIEFWYSTDYGNTWAENTAARIAVDTNDFSVEADGINAFIAYSNGLATGYVKASKAASYPGTAFTWSTSYDLPYQAGTNTYPAFVSITRDSDSKVWVAWRDYWSCFTAGTKITLADGSTKNIEDIKIGDTVIGFDPATGKTINSKVTDTANRMVDSYYIVKTENSSVNATAGHRFYVGNGEYKALSDLNPGDMLYIYDGGKNQTIKDTIISKTLVEKETTVYNFSTDNFHNYVANNYFVHNICLGTTYYLKTAESASVNDVSSWSSALTVNLVNSASGNNDFIIISPLASSHIYAAFVTLGAIKGCIYDADNSPSARWENSSGSDCTNGANTDSIATGITGLNTNISMVHDTANYYLHLAYIDASGYVQYQKYTTSWQTAVNLDGNAGNTNVSISINTSNNDLYALWIRGNHIYYKKGVSAYTSGDWDAAATDWKSTGTNTNLTSNYSGSGIIMAEWMSGSGSPYTINWDTIIVPENLRLLLSLGILVPLFARRKTKKSSVIVTGKTKRVSEA